MKEPSAGSMRAARRVFPTVARSSDEFYRHPMNGSTQHLSKVAQIIDHETGLPDLIEALELNMKWIGAPPIDTYSYDSARELAWEKGTAALKAARGES